MQIVKVFEQLNYIPIIKECSESSLKRLLDILDLTGLHVVEIACRSVESMALLQSAKRIKPHFSIGAGSISSPEKAAEAIDNGADYIMTAGMNGPVIEWCQKKSVAVFPGVYVSSDIELALSYGLKVLKFFPAGTAEASQLLDAYFGPYPDIKFIPAGGVKQDMIQDYNCCANVICCAGSWVLDQNLIEDQDFEEIERRINWVMEQQG